MVGGDRERELGGGGSRRCLLGGLLHAGAGCLGVWSLAALDWFALPISPPCPPALPLHWFLTVGHFDASLCRTGERDLPPEHTYVYSSTATDELLWCISPEAVALLRVLVLLCGLAIFWSMVGFCLDMIGPTRKPLRFLRKYAIPGIGTVLLVVAIIGVCYLASRALERIIKFQQKPSFPVHVAYDNGCYAITAAGVVALLATACNLLQEQLEPVPVARQRLLEGFEGLETFSVGMHNLPPPPPYTP